MTAPNGRRTVAALALAAGLLIGGRPAPAQTTRFEPEPNATIVLEGSSNVRDWTCRGDTIEGAALLPASLGRVNEVLDRIESGDVAPWMSRRDEAGFTAPKVRMEIPIATLRCGIRAMNRDMYEALEADEHPSIVFEMTRVAGPIVHEIDQGRYRITIEGTLQLAGTSRGVRLEVTGQRISRERFRFSGELPTRMTEFGIAPPTGLFGLIRARDELTVQFDFHFRAAAPTSAAGTHEVEP